MFIERGFEWCKDSGFNSMVTMQSWMFLSSYEAMREKLLQDRTIQTMAHLGARAFPEISGEVVQTTCFVMLGRHLNGFKPVFFRLVDTEQDQKETELKAGLNRFDSTVQDDFKKIPGSPIAYWVSNNVRDTFNSGVFIQDYAVPRQGFATGNNERFLRHWHEINFNSSSIKYSYQKELSKWYPCNKGGPFRKWYGNNFYVVNWENNGKEMKEFSGSVIRNPNYYFRKGTTWSTISSLALSMRLSPPGFLFETKGSVCFPDSDIKLNLVLALMNSKVVRELLLAISPTLDFHEGPIGRIPVLSKLEVKVQDSVERMVNVSKSDWDSYETSWDFTQNPIIRTGQLNLEQAFNTWQQQNAHAVAEMKRLEEENNKLFIDAYGLQNELTPDVPDAQITLTRADREKDSQRLVSYALGCMMGRYSLDESGLIYAHAGNQDFDASRYQTFPADADGIIPLTEMHWFEDDATHRIQEFLTAVWGKDTLDANMLWLAESLGKKASETAEDTIRRYLASKFYKDHMQTYKKRPIYWLFSSGKQGAFQALVYLHRYNESTLARMRTEYVMPLISKMAAYANSLETAKESSDSAAEIKRIEKKLQELHKQQAELSSFEEKLRHYADQRISLDLDDGVKVNYGKFGDLLAEVKAVTGEK